MHTLVFDRSLILDSNVLSADFAFNTKKEACLKLLLFWSGKFRQLCELCGKCSYIIARMRVEEKQTEMDLKARFHLGSVDLSIECKMTRVQCVTYGGQYNIETYC